MRSYKDMNDSSQALTGMIGLWLILQLAVLLALMLGGLYALYCLSRAASGLDRLAGAVEEWVQRENAKSAPPLPGSSLPASVPVAAQIPPMPPTPPSVPVAPASPLAATPPVAPPPPITPPSPLTTPTPFEVPPLAPSPTPDFIEQAFGETRNETPKESSVSSQNDAPQQMPGVTQEEKREF